ncbi:hypothetical protein BN12_4160026 [Nostocoides japonicum T1-X7]|uniref:Cytochrome P450 n=1 Tax=Nostocoides japonicum T1-X7 TaxID=1194083 RepID=A0A077M5B6_9MICO|nr:hypothetical protein BN12_4160026 [Tetrasphaera japonica T1-X7]
MAGMRSRRPELAVALLRHGYGYSDGLRERIGVGGATEAPSLPVRLLGSPALLVAGPVGVEAFTDVSRVRRHGATPGVVANVLFGHGAVHALDDEAHRVRKQLFVEVLDADGVARLVRSVCDGWEHLIERAVAGTTMSVEETSARVIGHAALDWAGIEVPTPVGDRVIRWWAEEVDGFGVVGPPRLSPSPTGPAPQRRVGSRPDPRRPRAPVLPARRIAARPGGPLARRAGRGAAVGDGRGGPAERHAAGHGDLSVRRLRRPPALGAAVVAGPGGGRDRRRCLRPRVGPLRAGRHRGRPRGPPGVPLRPAARRPIPPRPGDPRSPGRRERPGPPRRRRHAPGPADVARAPALRSRTLPLRRPGHRRGGRAHPSGRWIRRRRTPVPR